MPLNVWVLVAAQALAMCTAPFIVFIGSIQGRLLAPAPELATLPVGLVVVGTVLAIKPATWLMERVGRKQVMLLGAVSGVLAGLLGAYASWQSHFTLMCLAAVLGGAGLAVVHQYRFAAMESVAPDLAGSAAARVLLGGLVAAWLGPEVAGLGSGQSESYPFLYSWAGLAVVQALAFVILALGYRAKSERVPETVVGGGRPLREILANPLVWTAISGAAIGYAVMSFIMTATPLSMTEMAGHDLDDAKRVIQLHIMAMYLPSLISGWLTRIVGIPLMMAAGLLAYLACILLAASGISFHHYLWALLLLGVGWNFLFVGGTTLLPQGYQQSERFRVQGLNDMMVFTAQATAALSAGAVLASVGWASLLLVAVPLLVLHSVLMSVWLLRSRRATTN
ncbi:MULTISPECIES: MFS transporter [unclassified Marinobacter]|uniref:MFS transporter n=1 Tax=unclassified Marinobacter TaxID=83889 RepID=UPI00126808F0|nr:MULTISPECIES: MFS transporter [unclassified Marinobacter]QFS87237.1 Major Facilitator Superfamily protein [Marinobacter sp. THAF197a]QFT51021.1 Major Facilitator Superfamily protein [Marinobacter sp. THAF39]